MKNWRQFVKFNWLCIYYVHSSAEQNFEVAFYMYVQTRCLLVALPKTLTRSIFLLNVNKIMVNLIRTSQKGLDLSLSVLKLNNLAG